MSLSSLRHSDERGFTLVELVVAMAVFSFMLLIIVVGFMNIIRLHDEALAANSAQDNAQAAMNQLVAAVRSSQQVSAICNDTYTSCGAPTSATDSLCLDMSNTAQEVFFVGNGSDGTKGVLYQANNCPIAMRSDQQAITDTNVNVTNFTAKLDASGPDIVKPDVQLSLSVASNNATTTTKVVSGVPETTCTNNNLAREFCSVVSLTSGAVPR